MSEYEKKKCEYEKKIKECQTHYAYQIREERKKFSYEVLILNTQMDSLTSQILEAKLDMEVMLNEKDQQLVNLNLQLEKERSLHEITKGKLEMQTENVYNAVTAPRTTFVNEVGSRPTFNNTTNNHLVVANLTPELGKQLAQRLGERQFWEGQVGIARELRGITDEKGNKHFRVKDESRGKFEVNVKGKLIGDYKAVKIIKNVKKPVVERIGSIKDELLLKAERGYSGSLNRIDSICKAYQECIAFKDPK